MDSELPGCPDPPPAGSPENLPEESPEAQVVVGEQEQRWELVPATEVVGADIPKVVGWEDLQQELARLWSLSAALAEAKERKAALASRLELALEARRKSLQQTSELEEMRQNLQARDDFMVDLLIRMKVSEDVEGQREQICLKIRKLLAASKTLFSAQNKLQEANKLLSGENGRGRLKDLQKMLRMRQQYMVAQVANLYSVKPLGEQSTAEKLGLNSGGIKIRDAGSTLPNESQNAQSSLAILGLQLSKLPIKKTSYFGDKTEVQKSATVLGYVAHAVHLIASYLDVPLRYPVQLGGSRSYILDHAPSIESSADLAVNPIPPSTTTRLTEFPLFFEGQDTTRATYAIFLLNKDLEQLLNYIGAESLGPRHVLANLKQLTKIIQSQQYISS